MSIVSQIVGWLRARRCAPKDDVVSYSHADAADNITYDKRNYRGGVHPYSAGREQAVADLGCVRVLAQELSAELVRTVQHGERVTIRVANSALIAVAKRAGCYIPYEDRARFGDMKRRRSGESEVYAGADYSYLVKFKDPEAKQPLKNTEPTDWLFEHVVDRYSASIRLPDNIFQSVNGKCLQVPEASGSGMATVVGGLSSADIPQPVIGKSFPPVLALTSYTNLVLISSHCRSAQEKLFYIVLAARQRLKTRELTKCLGEGMHTRLFWAVTGGIIPESSRNSIRPHHWLSRIQPFLITCRYPCGTASRSYVVRSSRTSRTSSLRWARISCLSTRNTPCRSGARISIPISCSIIVGEMYATLSERSK